MRAKFKSKFKKKNFKTTKLNFGIFSGKKIYFSWLVQKSLQMTVS